MLLTLPTSEYDSFADIYAVWTDTAASALANRPFYVDLYTKTDGPVVELGVGDGRIAIEAALQGRHLIGVDRSASMLDLCRRRAERAGVLDRLSLIRGDFRSFVLDAPAALITLPYHSIGHLLTLEDKRRALGHILTQLRPGGRFVFDDFLMTTDLMAHMRAVQLRAEYRTSAGAEALLWVTSLVDEAAQSIRVVTWEDTLDQRGVLTKRCYRRLSLSWLETGQTRDLLTDVGFAIDACYGDFSGTPLSDSAAREQVWVARRQR